ncbi:MAG TPA: M23 family metallopeptidase [Dehalococcoidia bacterium]|nr:M23 family metallopeptidase [Dehalococcoidia bacterium]
MATPVPGDATAKAAVPSATAILDVPTVAPSSTPELHGFIYPIEGACLPRGDQLMPNAPRDYRNGTHEGIDFYGSDNCVPITRGTLVMAAKAGRVVRADAAYEDLTPAQLSALLQAPNAPGALDAFRGRQVWIDHGSGVVTRYCHLSGIASGLQVGDSVKAGEIIAYVGESGTPQSVTNPGTEYHLHFELRVGDSYLGQGDSAPQVRSLYLGVFAQ